MITSSLERGVRILQILGRLDFENLRLLNELQTQVTQALERGETKILIDCSRISFFDSSGIGSLVEAFRVVSGAQGTLRLCSVPTHMFNCLKTTCLLQVFKRPDSSQKEALDELAA
jgi:anti-anti-sigma factor